MTEIRVIIHLANAYRREQFALTGTWPKQEISLTLDAETNLDESLRRQVLQIWGERSVLPLLTTPAATWSGNQEFTFPSPPASAKDALKTYLAAHAAGQAAFAEHAAQKKAEEEKRAACNAQADAERQAKKEAESKRQAAWTADRDQWAQEHGSERLKLAIAGNYPCDTLYATERATLEFPDYTLDLDNNAAWDLDPESPPEDHLRAAHEITGEVVWLTHPPLTNQEQEEFEQDQEEFSPRFAVIKRLYLNRYDLVRTADITTPVYA